VAFSAPPSQDDLSRTALGEQHLRWLDQALPSLVEHALPAPRSQRGNWVGRLHELWGETWKPRLSLGQRAHISAEDRVMLDAGQLAFYRERGATLLELHGDGRGDIVLGADGSVEGWIADEERSAAVPGV